MGVGALRHGAVRGCSNKGVGPSGAELWPCPAGSKLLWHVGQALHLVAGGDAGTPACRWAGEAHFLLLNVPRILGINLPTLLSLVSSSAGPSPPPGLPASSFLQKTSKRL